MNYERLKKYNVEQELLNNQNTLVKLQIEHMIMQNSVLKELIDRNVAVNLPIMKYNSIVLNHEQQMNRLKPPNPRPQGMYS